MPICYELIIIYLLNDATTENSEYILAAQKARPTLKPGGTFAGMTDKPVVIYLGIIVKRRKQPAFYYVLY
jgi:hypothetical protein